MLLVCVYVQGASAVPERGLLTCGVLPTAKGLGAVSAHAEAGVCHACVCSLHVAFALQAHSDSTPNTCNGLSG